MVKNEGIISPKDIRGVGIFRTIGKDVIYCAGSGCGTHLVTDDRDSSIDCEYIYDNNKHPHTIFNYSSKYIKDKKCY